MRRFNYHTIGLSVRLEEASEMLALCLRVTIGLGEAVVQILNLFSSSTIKALELRGRVKISLSVQPACSRTFVHERTMWTGLLGLELFAVQEKTVASL